MGRDEETIEVEGRNQTWMKELKHTEKIEAALYRKKMRGRTKRETCKTKDKNRKRDSEGTDFTLASPGAVVWYEPSSAGMRLGWAHLTGVTPCPSHCGTAQSLCAHDACELALTHLVVHWSKARSSAVVWNSKEPVYITCLFIIGTNATQNGKV